MLSQLDIQVLSGNFPVLPLFDSSLQSIFNFFFLNNLFLLSLFQESEHREVKWFVQNNRTVQQPRE